MIYIALLAIVVSLLLTYFGKKSFSMFLSTILVGFGAAVLAFELFY